MKMQSCKKKKKNVKIKSKKGVQRFPMRVVILLILSIYGAQKRCKLKMKNI